MLAYFLRVDIQGVGVKTVVRGRTEMIGAHVWVMEVRLSVLGAQGENVNVEQDTSIHRVG